MRCTRVVEFSDNIVKKTHLLKCPELEDINPCIWNRFPQIGQKGECRYDDFNDCTPHITFWEDLTDDLQRILRSNRADKAHATRDTWKCVAEEAGLGHCAWYLIVRHENAFTIWEHEAKVRCPLSQLERASLKDFFHADSHIAYMIHYVREYLKDAM